jgi:predicted  nucleic acid-binding Zn-ribbon protein
MPRLKEKQNYKVDVLDDQMKSLKAQLNSAQEQLELGRATESHWRSKHSALESQLEDLKADMLCLQLGVKEKEQ